MDMEFNRQDWALIHDLINVAWATGQVKNPQMAQGVENLRAKVVAKLETPRGPDKKEDARGGK